jgi:phosphoglycolate phosphatase/pyrophosphatase PpaX
MEAYTRALKPYISRELTMQDVRSVQVISELRFMQHLAGEHYDACVADFRRHYAELHATHFDGVYPGVREALAALRARGVRMGIVTGKGRSSWDVTETIADLGRFDVIVVDDDVAEPKPHPEGILLALHELAVEPSEAVYVGDAIGDIIAATRAGVRPAAALWSRNTDDAREEFARKLDDYGQVSLLEQPTAVLDLFESPDESEGNAS